MSTQRISPTGHLALAVVLAAALDMPLAHADIFTWTDATGRLNISNVEPPKDVQARRIVRQDAPKSAPKAAAVAQTAEVEALKERVAELESEVDRTRQASFAPPPVPVVVVPPVVVAPPPAPAPALAYAPPPPPDVAPCDPLVFGCPAFGYPVNVVVLRAPRFHRFHGVRAARRPHGMPARADFGPRRR